MAPRRRGFLMLLGLAVVAGALLGGMQLLDGAADLAAAAGGAAAPAGGADAAAAEDVLPSAAGDPEQDGVQVVAAPGGAALNALPAARDEQVPAGEDPTVAGAPPAEPAGLPEAAEPDDPVESAEPSAPEEIQRDPFAPVARIVIPRAGVDTGVVAGTTPKHLALAPGFYPEGSLPHLGSNVAIAGHRTTYGAWFRHLDRLEAGDSIYLIYDGVLYRYEVQRVWVIANNDWSVIARTPDHVLTLTTCHPPGSSAYRLAVRARWVETVDFRDRALL
ncbi:MAG: sortase [Bacillota bacterium]